MRLLDVVVMAAMATVSGFVAGYVAREDLQQALEMRPPIVVLDYGPVATALQSGRPVAEIEPLFQELKRRSQALREHGFLVLNAASVDGVPDLFMVRLPDTPAAVAAPSASVPPPPAPISGEEAKALLSEMFSGRLR